MSFPRCALFLSLTLALPGCDNPAPMAAYSLSITPSAQQASDASFRGISTPLPGVAWATGSSGSIFRSLDSGANWQQLKNPGTEALDFRDVHAIDQRQAWLMAAGPGEASQVFHTVDGGTSWTLQLANSDADGFYDSIAFENDQRGFLLGDPIDGRFTVLMTENGGQNWIPLPAASSPIAAADEHCFAASGTVLVTTDDGKLILATGGAKARLWVAPQDELLGFANTTDANAWQETALPIRHGEASQGIFSVAFRDINHGIAVGGDYSDPENPESICARTVDGGKTWSEIKKSGPSGYRSAVAHVPGSEPPVWVAIGSHGADWSQDDGLSWQPVDSIIGYHAIAFAADGRGIAVGGPGVPFLQIQLSRPATSKR